MATKVVGVLGEWGIKEKVVGMSFDTTASNTGIHPGFCCRPSERSFGETPSKPCLPPPRHRTNPGRCVQGGVGPSSGPTIQLFKRFREQGPTSLMKIPKPSQLVDPRIDLVPSWKEASIGAMERRIQSKKVREDYRELWQPVPLLSHRKPPSADQEAGSLPPRPLDGKGNLRSKIRMFRSPVQMTTREGKGLEEIALFVVLLYSRAWMEAGLATEAAYNDLNLVKDLHHFQRSNGSDREDDPHHILPPSLVPRGPILWGCLFSRRGSAWRRRRRLLKRRGRKRTSTESGSTRLRISSSTRSLTHLQRLCSRAHPPQHRHLLPFPPLWTSGKQTLGYQKGCPQEEPQRHKRRGTSVGGDDFIVRRLPTKGEEKPSRTCSRWWKLTGATTLTPIELKTISERTFMLFPFIFPISIVTL
ncbi:hypothetical protein GWK47_046653 [Chionoecetes opilio]|uniref:Uncharacterized protein n=1 Tax=Chionoecetes opilio TaxID=41210 RepID=A0A8J4YEG2_CHIOP|nr:hypothetical protein GWK47_046653 [Chionoecetes opilio]